MGYSTLVTCYYEVSCSAGHLNRSKMLFKSLRKNLRTLRLSALSFGSLRFSYDEEKFRTERCFAPTSDTTCDHVDPPSLRVLNKVISCGLPDVGSRPLTGTTAVQSNAALRLGGSTCSQVVSEVGAKHLSVRNFSSSEENRRDPKERALNRSYVVRRFFRSDLNSILLRFKWSAEQLTS